MKHFLSLERLDVGRTLALTVGSPSVHRRGTTLKHVAFLLLFLIAGIGNVWGVDVTYTLTINGSDFNTTSYAANNNEKTTDAVCTTDNKKTYEVSWTSNQVMKNGNNMQWQKSKGYIYNSTDLGTISSVTVNSSAGSFTTYYGTSEQPSSGNAGSGNGYFKTSVGGATGTTSSIIVTFVISEGGGGSQEPTVLVDPASWNFGDVPANASASKVFSVSGTNLTTGQNLTLSAPTGYTVSPTNITVSSATLSATNVTVSKNTETQGACNGNLSITGGGLSSAKTVALTMNVTAPAHSYDYTHNLAEMSGFSTWGNSYGPHEQEYTNATVKLASANKSGSEITDVPVTKGGDVELILTNDVKQISAVKFVCRQWTTKAQTITLHYSTDGGETYSTLSPSVTSANFTIESTSLPKFTDAVKFTFSSTSNQVGLVSISYDLEDKPTLSSIAIKTPPTKVTYTANENFNPAGLVITKTYTDASTADVPYAGNESDFTFSPSTSTALNATHTAVTVTYGGKTANQTITVNRIATSLSWSANSYAANIGSQYSFPTLTKTPNNLSGVAYSSSNTSVATINATTGAIEVLATGETTITASFAQTNVYAAATPASYTLTINAANTPALEVDPAALNFGIVAVGENDTKIFALAGEHLEANATYEITGAGAAMFSIVSPTFPLTPDQGAIIEDVTVKYAPTAAGSHSATLTISSAGATSVEVALSGQAKVRRTVTWYKGDAEELTAQERGSATTSVLDGDEVTAIPAAPASCDDAISFMGWTDAPYAKNDAAPTPLYTTLGDFPAISGSNAIYYAVWAESTTASWAATTLNNITASDIVVIVGSADNDTYYAMENDGESSPVAVEVTVSNDKLSETPDDNLKWNISGNSTDGYILSPNGDATNHLYCSTDAATKNNTSWRIGAPATGTNRYLLEWSEEKSTMVTKDNSVDRYLCLYLNGETHDFRSYIAGSATATNLKFFKYNAPSGKDYTTTCAAPVEIANPTFSIEGGTYNDDQTLTISKTAPATTIYYTDDNSDPKNSATKKTYSSALTINQDVTIKAIATDGNGNWSEVVSKTYVINYSTSIGAFIEKAQASARTLKLNAAQNCIITGIREYNSKYDIYMQDASNKGIIVYGLTALPEGAAEGKRIEGAISGTYALTNGQHRITGANFANASFTNAEALTPAAITAVNADAYTANPIMLVKLSGVYYNTNSYYFTSEATGEGTSNYVYDSFKKFDGKTMPANTVACDITGILINYNGSTPELLPLSLTTSATAVLPAISPEGGADAENAEEVTYMSTVSVPMVENEEVYISVNDAEPVLLAEDGSVQIEGDVKLVVSAKRDFYADNTVTYYYKPSSYPKQIAVTSEHGDVVVKVGDNTVTTALPESNVTFTVAEAAHFHIASVAVNYEGGSLTPVLSEGKYSFTMPDKDVTIDLTYTEDTHYTITYAAGGATSGSAPTGALTWQYEGENVELLDNEYVWNEDHNFTGWKVTYGETELDKAVGQSFEMPAANVTITAQWVEKQYCALTLKVNGADYLVKNIEQTIEQTISELAGYADPASQSGYDFFGWATSQETEDVTEAIATIESYTPEAGETSKTLYAVFKRVDEGAPKTDVLTAADLAATSTTYTDFSNVSKTSNAVYAGNSAKDDAGSIQLRSKNSNSGIVTTSTGGILKSVTINVGSGSATIDVYGSNTAYSAASDLYGSAATQGTKIGSTSTTNTINAAADYKYVGIRSNSGAIYLSSVEITWKPKTTYYTTAPSAVYAVSYALGGGAWQEDEGCDGANVKAGQTFDICKSMPVREHYKFNGWTIGGNAVSGTITINGATAITANWIAKVENNITYNAGSGSGSDAVVGNNEEGAEIVLPSAADKSFSKSGFDFVGWLYNGNLYKAGTTFEMPASAVTFVAQWKKQNITKMTLVTDASQLVDGSKVVLANQTASTVAGESAQESETYLTKVDGTFNEEKSILTNLGDGIELTLVQVTGGWALEYNGKYLKPYSTNKVAWDATPTVWTISISSNNAIIETLGNSGSALRYNKNTGSERFSAYSSKESCEPIQLYASVTSVTGDASISEIGYVEGDVIVVSSGATLTMDAPSAPASITVKENAVVNVSAATEAGTVIVEKGAKLAIEEGGSVTTNEPLVLYTTLGKGTGTNTSGNAPGSSSEIINAERLNATGDVFIEIELTQDAKASAGWYAFSVPFPVDAMNGVYYGDTKLTNEVGYAIMSHYGELRAKDEYAWKKFRGIMQPGVFYVITVGNTDYKTLRFKKVADEALVASSSVAVSPFPTQTGNNADGAWNGIGNPNLAISNLSTAVTLMQFYDHKTNTFIGRNHSVNLVVGSAFFIQYNGGETVSIPVGTTDYEGVLAPRREQKAVEEMIYEVQLTNVATGELEDNVFLTAREDATNEYEIGRDVAKLSMGTAKCAQMWIPAYGTKLCAADFQLVNDKAEYPLTLNAPSAGTYSISMVENDAATIYLTYEGSIIWNLSMGTYELDLNKGTTNGYGLLLNAKMPMTPTGVDEVQSDKVQCTKVVIDEHVYILRGGQMYDVTGKAVK